MYENKTAFADRAFYQIDAREAKYAAIESK